MSAAPVSWSSLAGWPRAARGGLLVLIAVLPALALGRLSLYSDMHTLRQLRAQAEQAREDYHKRLAQNEALDRLRERRLVLLDALWPQRSGAAASVQAQAWTQALLQDLHGAGQGLRFELFRPGAPVRRPHHEELPLTLRVVGTYQGIAAFVADLATLAHVVAVDRMMLAPRTARADAASTGSTGEGGSEAAGLLVLDLVARACRPFDGGALGSPPAGPVPSLGAEATQPRPARAPAGAPARDPFDPRRLAGLSALLTQRPDTRSPQPLEARPLSALRMVGSLRRGDEVVALVQADQQVYQVPVGAALDMNRARVLRISEAGITVRELLRGPAGEPLARTVTLPLQGLQGQGP